VPKAGIAARSITWSARSSSYVGTSTPIAFAVFRFIIVANFIGCSTGRLG